MAGRLRSQLEGATENAKLDRDMGSIKVIDLGLNSDRL